MFFFVILFTIRLFFILIFFLIWGVGRGKTKESKQLPSFHAGIHCSLASAHGAGLPRARRGRLAAAGAGHAEAVPHQHRRQSAAGGRGPPAGAGRPALEGAALPWHNCGP